MVDLWKPPEAPWTASVAARADEAQTLLARIAEEHPTAALATSIQAESSVLIDLIARAALPLAMFMLDTGRMPAETLQTKQALEQRYGRMIAVFKPDPDEVKAWVAAHGADGFYDSAEQRASCCELRKVRPLKRALSGRSAWITGQRREQAQSRADLREREPDPAHGIVKFNPLAEWSAEDVWAYVRAHEVPVNPLHARGYASIGCDPCTRAIRANEGERDGRWWWEQSSSKECGIHAVNLIAAK